MTTTPTVQFWNGSAWTDISTKVKSYSYTAGRLDEISGASAGQATFVLDNADSSVVAVGVNLLPKMTPIRVMVNGNTQPRFTGWVDGSPVTFRDPEGTSTLVTVTAADSLALMQRHKCQTSIYEQTLATVLNISAAAAGSYSPVGCGYWPLSDPAGSVAGYEATGTGLYGVADFSGAGATFGDTTTAMTAQTSAIDVWSTGKPGVAAIVGTGSIANGISVGGWMRVKSGDEGWTATSVTFGSGLAGQLSVGFSGSVLTMTATDDNGHTATATGGTVAGAPAWVFVAATLTAAGAYQLFVNDTVVASATVPSWSLTSSTLGAVSLGLVPRLVGSLSVALAHCWAAPGIYAGGIYGSAANTLGGLTTTQLLSTLAFWAVPINPYGTALDSQNSGTLTPSGGITFLNNDCLSLSQVAVETEDGPLYCNRSGAIANLTHRTLTDRAAGAVTAAFVNGDVESDLTPARDAQFLITNAQITALSGSGGVLEASRNLAKFGNYLLQKSLYVTDAQATDYATWKTLTYGDINYSRVGKFTIDLLCSTDIQTAALAIDVGSRVTFTGLPPQAGFTTADVIVQGFTENWTIDGWLISFNTTPSTSYLSWILEDATYGLLDQTTVLGY